MAEDAKRYLAENSLLNVVIAQLIREAMDTFVASDVGSDKARDAHGRIKSMNEIKASLKALVDDVTVAAKRERYTSANREGNTEAWNI